MAIFMTGATGFVGRYLMHDLVERNDDLVLLVRGQDPAGARAKVERSLGYFGEVDPSLFESRIRVCLGQLDRPDLGLSVEDRQAVVESCDQIIHCGATVRFDHPLAEARAVNVDGTRAMLNLARECQSLNRFDYIGTAFVAGLRTDVVGEDELDGRAGHKNTYEQSKYEAEHVIREAWGDLPITIHRPSIVTGESAGGRTSSFKMIYWPAKVYAMGLWRICPGNPATPVDLVPVDFVRDAILQIRSRPESVGRCFHIASGPQGDVTLDRMAEILQSFFEGKPVRFVDPGWWMRFVHPMLKTLAVGPIRRVVRTGESYVPYFIQNPRFDNAGALDLLGETVTVPKVSEYVENLFRYCIETDWGRKSV